MPLPDGVIERSRFEMDKEEHFLQREPSVKTLDMCRFLYLLRLCFYISFANFAPDAVQTGRASCVIVLSLDNLQLHQKPRFA
jgi:hypothetical protein